MVATFTPLRVEAMPIGTSFRIFFLDPLVARGCITRLMIQEKTVSGFSHEHRKSIISNRQQGCANRASVSARIHHSSLDDAGNWYSDWLWFCGWQPYAYRFRYRQPDRVGVGLRSHLAPNCRATAWTGLRRERRENG